MKGVRSRVEQKVYMDILNDNVKFENKNHFVVSNGMFASKNDKGARNVTSNTVSNTENVDSGDVDSGDVGDVGGGGNTVSNDSPQIGAAVKKSNNPFI
ncbi:hypothetical protein AX774_g6341 [Zancudomyces culisetae]|uniref:Uncharacterized protein n=1 Tax=Zancudomyces culisetae TaxID=1213189 RepID=A0A1R1PH31_ZANCU|nr:hypothetical protein AX774_g6341 [Zancudomyces culisetae]|eukprot:OMH80223.1 hypothetical protein AX774_g6341 [Zancudomyces culisetae]